MSALQAYRKIPGSVRHNNVSLSSFEKTLPGNPDIHDSETLDCDLSQSRSDGIIVVNDTTEPYEPWRGGIISAGPYAGFIR